MSVRALSIIVVAAAVNGCMSISSLQGTPPGQSSSRTDSEPGSSQSRNPADRSRAALAEAGAMLDEAKSALERRVWHRAIERAKAARERLAGIAGYSSTEDRKLHNAVTAESILVEGHAYRGMNDPLGAVLALDTSFEPDDCRADMVANCRKYDELLYKQPTYRRLLTTQNSTYGYSTKHDHVVSFNSTTLGNTSLTTTEMGMLPNFYGKDADYLALWVTTSYATKLKATRSGENHTFTLTGKSYKDAWTSCNDLVAEVEIGGDRFDVMRCKEIEADYTAATLKFTLPAAEAAKVTLDNQRALVVYRRKDFKRLGGTTWTLGNARLVRVETHNY